MDDENSWKIILAKFFTKTAKHSIEIPNQINQSDRLLDFLNSILKVEMWKIYQSFGGKLYQSSKFIFGGNLHQSGNYIFGKK